MDTFLQSNFLYWLEAMSLIKKVSESIYMINSLQSLTNVRNFRTSILVIVLTCDLERREHRNIRLPT